MVESYQPSERRPFFARSWIILRWLASWLSRRRVNPNAIKKFGNRAFQTLRQRLLEESCGYILFPEGTRSRDGRMTAFKAGVGMLVAGTDVPVVPCWLSGCFDALPAGRRRARRRRIELHVGESIQFTNLGNDKHGWQQAAQTLEEAVRRLQNDCGSEAAFADPRSPH